MKLNYKNRIALYYMLVTAFVIGLVFLVIFFIVKGTVFQNLDNELKFEAEKHTTEIEIKEGKLFFNNKKEWEEHEHREVQVNPVFIQIIDVQGRIMDRSPNLKSTNLPYHDAEKPGIHFNTELNGRALRQVQMPIVQHGKITGYIVAAKSLESSNMVIKNLKNVLFLLFPIIIIGLFFVSRYLAGRSILPIQNITDITNRITRSNLSERIDLPVNKDELHELSSSINDLLDRIESAISREQQFTSDASHELRTPLAALRGTIEILGRKPRTVEEYQDKLKYSLNEVDRMTVIIDQLLLIARMDESGETKVNAKIPIQNLIDNIITRYSQEIAKKSLRIEVIEDEKTGEGLVPEYYSNLILVNIINNAVKYSNDNGEIIIKLYSENGSTACSIQDYGIGINSEDLPKLFQPFYRSQALDHKDVKGSGLGLSIANKASKMIGAELEIFSKLNEGTLVQIIFK